MIWPAVALAGQTRAASSEHTTAIISHPHRPHQLTVVSGAQQLARPTNLNACCAAAAAITVAVDEGGRGVAIQDRARADCVFRRTRVGDA